MSKKFKVFLGIHEICGHNTNLETGLRLIDIDCDFYSLNDKTYYNSGLKSGILVNLWRYFYKLNIETPRNKIFKKIYYASLYRLFNIFFIFKKVIFYNVLIFSYGITITNSSLELIFYKILRKKIIFVFFGSDSRPPYMASKYVNDSLEVDVDNLERITRAQKNKIRKIEKYADYCINWGPSSHFHEKSFINMMELGFPLNLEPKNTYKGNTSIVEILHVPSDINIKKTNFIMEILDELSEEGVEYKLNLLSNVPNSTVLKAIERCDFIIDCQYSDTPLGILGIEAALLGKPTIVGGYLYKDIYKYYSGYGESLPALYTHPDKMKSGIKKLIQDSDFRKNLSNIAYQFATKNYNLSTVAKHYSRIFEGDIPENWWFDPKKIEYIYGSVSKKRIKDIIINLVSKYGIESLQLSDKPILEKKLLKFIHNENSN
jgi:hypothetical protein